MTPFLQTGLLWLIQSTLLLLLGLLSLQITRKYGPALQTLIGRATLVAVALTLLLAYPLAGHIQPLWHVSLPSNVPRTSPQASLKPSPLSEAAPPRSSTLPRPTFSDPELPFTTHPTPAPPVSGGETRSVGVGLLWPLGTTLLLLWLAACVWHLTTLRCTARCLTSGPTFDILSDLAAHPPKLFAHPSVHSPFLAGICHPAIFLPMTAEAEFSPAALRAILAHELAHRDRRDTLWLLLSRLLAALLYPQPLLWLLCHRLEEISEGACDQSVLARNCPPRAYANCLLSLAECWQPSRRERALGAGAAPFRSSIGRRITKILANGKPLLGLTLGLRFGILACALLAVFGSVLLLNTGVDVPHFTWAKQQGWTVQPIKIVNLDPPNMLWAKCHIYTISAKDRLLVKQWAPANGGIMGSPNSASLERQHLDTALANQPHFFYTEFLLSNWHRRHGEAAEASALLAQSLRDAPTVLAGRYQFEDGTPLAGFEFQTTITCYASDSLNEKSGVPLNFEVVTDSEGCYYLPVFRAIYNQRGIGWSTGQLPRLTAGEIKGGAALVTPGPLTSGMMTSADPISGTSSVHLIKGFVAESHVAVMPQTEVRPKLILNAPFSAGEGSVTKPLTLTGSHLTISWQPYPKAASYRVHVDEHHPRIGKDGSLNSDQWSEIRASASNPSQIGLPIKQTKFNLDFTGLDPIFNRRNVYGLTVQPLGLDGEPISQSETYYFQSKNALAPLPLTKAALAQVLGSGFTVVSMEVSKDKVIVNAISPANFQGAKAAMDAIDNSGQRFGYSFASWSSRNGIHVDEPNAAQPMLITFGREGG